MSDREGEIIRGAAHIRGAMTQDGAMRGALEIGGLCVDYGRGEVLRDIDLLVPAGQLLCVLGPSGSGKSTLLRAIAGLERPTRGRLTYAGRDIGRLAPHERGFGLMFQDFALFPHRDVAGNVAFGLRMAGWDTRRIEERVARLLELVGMPGMGDRAVSQLSGGEQQRVALARALAPDPLLLMLDEPMGSLDRALRDRLPLELRETLVGMGMSVIYVTHDQEEALSIADRVVLLRDGRIAADDSPEDLWGRPPSAWAARFLGFRNVAQGDIRDGRLVTPWGEMDPGTAGSAMAAGASLTVVLRPDGLVPSPDGELRGVVTARRFRGDHALIEVRASVRGGDDAWGEVAPPLEVEARWRPLPAPGDELRLAVEPRAMLLIEERADR